METGLIQNGLIIPADEGSINQIYGQIGSGKTYVATYMILQDLKRGQVVYANWKLNFEGYDERQDNLKLLLGIFGLKRYFIKIPKENFYFLDSSAPDFHQKLSRLTDCIIYLDEGHIQFDSYVLTKMPIENRANILHTRHFDRTINIISQRATAIHATLRGNVNRFFKCEKGFHFRKLIRFHLYEFQDLDVNERPDETKEPVSHDSYWGRQEIFNMYSTKYLRGDTPASQDNLAEEYFLTWRERWKNLFSRKKVIHDNSTFWLDSEMEKEEN